MSADDASPDPAAPELEPDTLRAVVEQYKTFVQQTAEVTAQRAEANRFFVTINAVMFAAYGFVWDVDRIAETALLPMLLGTVALSGMLACWRWRTQIRDYKRLLHKRFEIIMKVEADLPWKPYVEEYELFCEEAAAKGKRRAINFSMSELHTPWGFSVLHAVILTSVLYLTMLKVAGAAPPVELCGWFHENAASDPCSLLRGN